jgi:hypothetical protein
MTSELKVCREFATHFKWIIERQSQQLERLRNRQ